MARPMLALVGSVLVAGALAAAGCAAAPPSAAPVAPSTAAQQPGEHAGHQGPSNAALWAVQTGPLGVVATDASGHFLYRYEADSTSPPASRCTGPCAQSWLPMLLAPGEQPQLMGVDSTLVGTITRPEGTIQITLAGWPLYRDRDDLGGLQNAGRHGQDNTWFVITPTGDKASGG